MMHIANIEEAKPAEKPSILTRALNTKQTAAKEGKPKTAGIDLQIKNKKSFIETQVSTEMKSSSPKHKISFNFMSSGGSQNSNELKRPILGNSTQSPRKVEKVDSLINKMEENTIRMQVLNAKDNIYVSREFDHPHLFQRKFDYD